MKEIKMYGSMLCKHCKSAVELFDEKKIPYEFIEIRDSLKNLKEFLKLRDENSIFDEVKKEGKIGIPCMVDPEDGSLSLDPEDFLKYCR